MACSDNVRDHTFNIFAQLLSLCSKHLAISFMLFQIYVNVLVNWFMLAKITFGDSFYLLLQSSEAIDVYSFGHLFYEMVFGRPLNQPTIEFLPPNSPAEIRK